jgi:hypothetical protein
VRVSRTQTGLEREKMFSSNCNVKSLLPTVNSEDPNLQK